MPKLFTSDRGLVVNQIIKYHAYNGVIVVIKHDPTSSNTNLQIGLHDDGSLKSLSFFHVSNTNQNPTDCMFSISVNNNAIDITYNFKNIFYTLNTHISHEDMDNINKAIRGLYMNVISFFEKSSSQPDPGNFPDNLFQVAREHAKIIKRNGGNQSAIKEQIPSFINGLILTVIHNEANRLDSMLSQVTNAPRI